MGSERFQIKGTRLGPALVVGGKDGLLRVMLPGRRYGDLMEYVLDRWPDARETDVGLKKALKSVVAFFETGRSPARGIRLDLSGVADFDRAVYEALLEVEPGKTVTYGALARRIGREGANRAVGAAVARNPLPIFIPCHRVLRSDGSLGGYREPGGLPLKEEMLRLEGLFQ